MNPIINPMWFYLIDMLDGLSFIAGLLVFVLIFVLFLSGWGLGYLYLDNDMWEYTRDDDYDDDRLTDIWKNFTKWWKRLFVLLVVLLTLTILVPSEQTIYKMMIATYATGDNIEIVLDKITDGVDYIFDKIDEVKE